MATKTKRKRVSAVPEVPVDLRLMRNSETQTFKDCRQWWEWAYVKFYKARAVSPPLTIGSMVHDALETYYPKGRKRGPKPASTVLRTYRRYLEQGGQEIRVKTGKGEDTDKYVDAGDLMVEMMENYVKLYGKDDYVEVVAPEQLFQVDVFDPKTGLYVCTQVGQIDLVFRDLRTNRVGFMEHKTGATLEPFGAPEELDEQTGTYWTYGPTYLKHTGQIPEDMELDFIMFNRMKKSFGDKRAKNAEGLSLNLDGKVSKQQPAPLFKRSMIYRNAADSNILDKRIRAVALEMEMVRNGQLEIYKHPDKHCGYCEFRPVCEVHESGGDYRSMFKMMYTKWEPYSEHELEMEAVG